MRASFLFVGDLNGHHQEWLGFTTANRHGVAAFDFAIVSGFDQLVVGPAHVMMIDVPDLVRVAVITQLVTQITPFCWQSFRWHRLFQTCVSVGKFSEIPS